MLLFDLFPTSHTLVKALVPAFMAILFLQSGLNKVFNYQGNLAYITDFFKNTPLSKMSGLLFPTITILEVAAGVLSAFGGIMLLVDGSEILAYWGLVLSAVSFLCLFLGQRIAQDYGGAAAMAGYFVVNIVGLLLLL